MSAPSRERWSSQPLAASPHGPWPSRRLSALLVLAAAAVVALAMLAAAGQPLFTDDLWWHLALGEAYAEGGPRLAADPLLFTAEGPPLPAAWLADVALFATQRLAGFTGLRVLHVALVLGILALAASSFRRASGSRVAAALLLIAFVALSAYRLFQLRPELATLGLTLLTWRLLLAPADGPGVRRSAVAAALFALWANLHAGFLLGPVLLATGCGALLAAAPLRSPSARAGDLARARRLALALALGSAATLLNPAGLAAHLTWVGGESVMPELWRVGDEWARTDLFRLPAANLPPTPLAWALCWTLLLATPAAAAFAVRGWRRAASGPQVDPVVVGLAAAGLVAMAVAVRFLWLGILPLLLLGAVWRARAPGCGGARAAAAAAVVAAGLATGFFRAGDWPMISRGLSFQGGRFAVPYPAGKYHAHAVWMLRDAGVTGRLFNDYPMGGFLGYWLAPQVATFVNGSLNLSPDALDAARALRERRGQLPGEGFEALLDRHRIDVFFGIDLPRVPPPNRPWTYTTAHLEGVAGWLPIFRDARSALYLRDLPRNRANLERVASWYAREGVPFDPARGFDPEAVLREAPEWGIRHGLAPVHFPALANQVQGFDPTGRRNAGRQLAPLYAALGLYERAVRLDGHLLQSQPDAVAPQRRLLWSLLHLGRAGEALEAIAAAPASVAADPIVAGLADAARRVAEAEARGEADVAARIVSALPVFTPWEAAALTASLPGPPARAQPPERSLVRP